MRRVFITLLLICIAVTGYAADPVITFNATVGGSDVAASGSGGTAIIASGNNGAQTTNPSAVVNLSVDSPDLSSLASPTGAEVLWVDTATGRQFSVITVVDNTAKTVTCADNFTSAGSGLNWGIGGKRATWNDPDSRKLFTADFKTGWTIRTESDQSISSAFGLLTGVATLYIEGDSASTLRVINQTTNTNHWGGTFSTRFIFKNLKFTNSAGSKTAAIVLAHSANSDDTDWTFINCVFGDTTNTIFRAVDGPSGAANTTLTLDNCLVRETTSQGINLSATTATYFFNTRFWKCASHAVNLTSTSEPIALVADGCVFDHNAGDAIAVGQSAVDTAGTAVQIKNCVFDHNTGDAIDGSASLGMWQNAWIVNNIFSFNGTGIKAFSGADGIITKCDHNCFYSNTADRSNISAGPNDSVLDPQFVDSSDSLTADFSIGTNLKALGNPSTSVFEFAGTSLQKSYVDIGAAQRQESAGGGAAVDPINGGPVQ